MNIDPDQIRAEIDALLAQLPDPANNAEDGAVARRARRDSAPPFRGARRAAAGAGVGGEGLSARMARRARVDAELVRRGLARSRQQAAELIGAGKVSIDGMPALKPGTAVAVTAALTVADDSERSWVSRGAHKLIGALDTFGIPVAGRRCLDAGASTGGFTEVLLDRGAAEVVAADVGYGQLAWSLRCDPRVIGRRADQRASTCRPRRSAGRSTWWWPTCRSSRWPPCCPR